MLHLELVCLKHQQNKVLTMWVAVTDRLLFHLDENNGVSIADQQFERTTQAKATFVMTSYPWRRSGGFCAHSQRHVPEMSIVGIPALTVIVLFTESRKKLSELII